MEALEYRTDFYPAYDMTAEGCGIHGVNLQMAVVGSKGAVSFQVFTNWQLSLVDNKASGLLNRLSNKISAPFPAGVDYHSLTPQYEGQKLVGAERLRFGYEVPAPDDPADFVDADTGLRRTTELEPTDTFTPCELLKGQPCYCGGSSLAAEPLFDLLVRKGSKAVFEALEKRYHDYFNDAT